MSPQVVNAAIPATKARVSCDFAKADFRWVDMRTEVDKEKQENRRMKGQVVGRVTFVKRPIAPNESDYGWAAFATSGKSVRYSL